MAFCPRKFKPSKTSVLKTLPLDLNLRRQNNAQLSCISSDPVVHGETNAGRRGGGSQARVLNGSYVSLSILLNSVSDCDIHRCYCKVPFVLPHPSSLFPVQENLSLIVPRKAKSFNGVAIDSNNYRGICSVAGTHDEAQVEVCKSIDFECESEVENSGGDVESVKLESKADPNEVDRVCKVINELFALDRNMEAVLDESGVNLSHDLVVDVLERFKHARKPAFRFFCWASRRSDYAHDSRTYNAMMNVLGKTRQFETMLSLLEEMGEKGLLTMETFVISMKAFVAAKERKKAIGMFELMKKYKFKVGVETVNCLLDAMGRAKLGKEAQIMFEKLEHRFKPNLQTYTVLLNGWCRVKNLIEAGRVWNVMIDKGFKTDIVAHNTMLEGLLRGHRRSDAVKFFEVMKAKGPAPNVRTYTILIRDWCKQKKMEEATDCFDEMIKSGCEPDAGVYTCLLTGYGNEKKMDKVFGLLKKMKDKGCPPDAQMYNALIKLMTNRRMPDDAVRIYKKMVKSGIEATIHTYNMMMKSFFGTMNYDMGLAVWEEMNKKGCCPDENSYIVVISGLIRQGRPAEACKFLEEMMGKGMKAPQLDYNKFAADFSRAGRPNIMEELAQKMKFSGKFEDSNLFARWADMMKKQVKARDQTRSRTSGRHA